RPRHRRRHATASRAAGQRQRDPRRGVGPVRNDGGPMSRVAYLVREALVNLRRNILVVAGAVLAVFISLGLAFGALAVNELVRINTVAWQEGVHLIVWLNDAGRDGVPADAHQTLLAEVQD